MFTAALTMSSKAVDTRVPENRNDFLALMSLGVDGCTLYFQTNFGDE